MIALAISILWFLLGALIFLGVVWLVLYAVKIFLPVPGPIEKAIWCIVLILCLIYLLMALSGGAPVFPHYR